MYEKQIVAQHQIRYARTENRAPYCVAKGKYVCLHSFRATTTLFYDYLIFEGSSLICRSPEDATYDYEQNVGLNNFRQMRFRPGK